MPAAFVNILTCVFKTLNILIESSTSMPIYVNKIEERVELGAKVSRCRHLFPANVMEDMTSRLMGLFV